MIKPAQQAAKDYSPSLTKSPVVSTNENNEKLKNIQNMLNYFKQGGKIGKQQQHTGGEASPISQVSQPRKLQGASKNLYAHSQSKNSGIMLSLQNLIKNHKIKKND